MLARQAGSRAAAAEILPALGDAAQVITRSDPAIAGAFRVQLVEWFLHRVYNELNGPLTDAIAPIPRK